MGQQPIPWAYMARYITTFQALLRGETAEWDGSWLRMLHTGESVPRAPHSIPVYISALGQKGVQVATSLAADGLFAVGALPEAAQEFQQVSLLAFGSVLDDGEPLHSDRLRSAAGPGLMQAFHATCELGGEEAVRPLPGGADWLASVLQTPEHQRHLAVHAGHLLHLNDADAAAWNAGAHALLEHVTLTGAAGDVLKKVQDLAAKGVTEIVYRPAGDIRRELEAFAAATAYGAEALRRPKSALMRGHRRRNLKNAPGTAARPGGAGLAQVAAERADQDGRDGDDADCSFGAVLEAAGFVRCPGAGPGGAGARAGRGEDDLSALVRGEDEIVAAQGDGFFRAQRRVVQAAEERGQFRPGAGGLVQDGADLRRAGEGDRADGDGGLGWVPVDLLDRVGGQQPEFDGVPKGAVEHGPLAADRARRCGRAVQPRAQPVQGGPDDLRVTELAGR
jgi:5,10-methylenetetrahydromethanopterin reductase